MPRRHRRAVLDLSGYPPPPLSIVTLGRPLTDAEMSAPPAEPEPAPEPAETPAPLTHCAEDGCTEPRAPRFGSRGYRRFCADHLESHRAARLASEKESA
ncbi:hypothetical protein O7630_31675 [Micromonospora sp. WMMD718]|uniref:hypothetical protein n=1 Tax=Micromonospora sp. WMMD718 TaxID=3016098 RepID=UPI002417055F|nr:hypothetical protein [Micromonospora sp. WMMD718]MDG4755506.1 hypothetical protein [Micromonospora sp. WMMD718]